MMMLMASNGHFFVQIPHPMQSVSDKKAILDDGVTSIHSRPAIQREENFRHGYESYL